MNNNNYYYYYYTKKNKHNTFGGEIYQSDFDRHTTMSEIAERILSDEHFDNQCRRNIIARDRNK